MAFVSVSPIIAEKIEMKLLERCERHMPDPIVAQAKILKSSSHRKAILIAKGVQSPHQPL